MLLKLIEKIATNARTNAISQTKSNEAGIIAYCPNTNITSGIPI